MTWGGKPSSSSSAKERFLSWRLFATLALAFALLLPGCAADTGQEAADEAATAQSANSASEGAADTKAVPTQGMPAKKIDESADARDGAPDESSLDAASEGQPAAADDLIVRFIDVGQGDCALITCGNDSLLIDGGPAGSSSKVYSILKDLGITRLDAVVVTHPDADHCGGIAGALNAVPCDVFCCSTDTSDTETFRHLTEQLERQDSPIVVPDCGDSFSLGGATCTFVGPARSLQTGNDNSLIVRVEYGTTSFLFAADAEGEAEQSLLASGGTLTSDVLKVGHHGSPSSSTPSFLRAVAPRYAVISVGENSYGHPSPVVLDRLDDLECETFRTDEAGSIVFRSDGENLSVKTVKGELHE